MAGQELASLVLSVDTRPMDAATVSMDKATLAAERLNAATDRLAKAGAAASGSRSSKIVDDERKIEEALGKEILAIQRNTAAYERMQTQAAKMAMAGIRSPQAVADELRSLAAARDMWEQAGKSAQGYAGAMAQITARTNVLTEGNARARGAIRETAAAMASLAFEAAGAAFLVTAVGGALAAPAFFGVSMLKRVEDAQTGIAGILVSMGTLDGKALTFEQSMAASGEYVKKIQEDSLKFGIEMGKLVEVNQAAMSGGLAAMLTLDQIQKVATAGAIAVSSLGLNSQQYVQEVRDLISGGIQPASSTLARSIGVTDALLKQWKAEGPSKLVGELTSRLEGFVLVADKVRASTLTGAWDILQARLALLMSDTEGFGALKKVVIDVADYIGTIDPVSNKFTLNPQLVETVRSYWDILKSVGATLVEIGKAFAALAPIVQVAASAIASVAKYLTEIVVVSSALAGARWFAGLITSASAATVSVGGLTAAMRAFVTSNPILVATTAIVAGIAAVTEGFDSATRSMKTFEQSMKGMAVNELYAQRQKLQTQLMLEEKSWTRNGALVSQYRQEISLLTREINRAEAGKPTGGTSMLGAITGTPQVDEAGKKKALAAADREAKKAREEAIKANTDYVESQMKVGAEIDRESESLKKKIEQDQFEIASIGKTKEEIALLESTRYDHTTTMMRERLAILDSTNACTAESEALRENIKLRDKYKAVQIDKAAAIATQERVKAEQKAHEDMWKSIESVAHDTWTRVWTEGSSAFQNIGKVIKSALIDMLYQMTVKKWIIEVSTSSTGSAVSSAVSAATGGSGGLGSWLSAGKSIFDAVTGGFSKISSMISGGLQQMGVSAATASSIGAAGSYAGAAMAAMAISNAIGGDKKFMGMSSSTTGLLFGGLGGLLNAAFGSGPKVSGTTTLAGSFTGQGFAGNLQTPWSQSGGWFSGGGSGIDVAALAADQTTALSGMVTDTKAVFDALITASGEANKSLTGWTYSINRQVATQEQMQALTVDLADSMGNFLLPQLAALKRQGESMADTAMRLRDTFIATDELLRMVNATFGAVGLASAGARTNLVDLMGGLQQMGAALQSYYANFFTDADRHARALTDLSAQFTALGLVMPDTAAGFRALVDAQDLSTQAGRETFSALMNLNGAFAALIPNAQAAAQATQANIDALKAKALQDAQALQGSISTMRAFVASIRELQGSLWTGSSTPASPSASLSMLRQQFSSAAAGGIGSQGALAGAATSYLDAARAQATSMTDYARTFSFVQNSLDTAANSADEQVTIADQQLTELRAANGWLSSLDERSTTQNQSLSYLLSAAIASNEAARMAVVDQSIAQLTDQIRTTVGAGFNAANLSTVRDTTGAATLQYAGQYATVSGSVSASGTASAVSSTSTAAQVAAQAAADAAAQQQAVIEQQQAAASAQRTATRNAAIAAARSEMDSAQAAYDAAMTSASTRGAEQQAQRAFNAASAAAQAHLSAAEALPAFANGGFHTGGLRLVGENGPELEYTGPSQIISNGDTKAMLSNKDVVEAINQLRDELRAGQIAISGGVQKAAKILDRWDGNGMPDLREAA